MTYSQTVTPTPNIPCQPGWCLQYVRQAYSLPARYATATEAWNNSPSQHRDRNFPAGVWVPVWFSLANEPAGHVALMAPDGSVYSTSDYATVPHHHLDLSDLMNYYARYDMTLTYLGWTEDVAGYPVITGSGITAQGEIITPQEGDEMAELFGSIEAFRDRVIESVFDARFDTRDENNKVTGTISLRDMLTYYPANVALDRKQVRDGLSASVKSIVAAVKAGQTVDPDAVAAQIAEKLDGITFSVARKEG